VTQAGMVLVPLDGSRPAEVALPVAAALARIGGGTLRVLHVSDRPLDPSEVAARVGAAGLPRGAIVEGAHGAVHEEIVRAATEGAASFIVLTPHTGPVAPRGGLGRTAYSVLRRAPCPVVFVPVARGQRTFEPTSILVALDGTPSTAMAVRPAGELAARVDATVFLLHVAPPDICPGRPSTAEAGTIVAPSYVDQPHHEWPEWAREFVERAACLSALPPSVRRRLFVVRGEPGAEIVHAARTNAIDLVVLGWHGTIDPRVELVAETVFGQAPCPVLVVRASPVG